MQSMTGYGKETSRQGDWEMTVELRAVNHRFLDLSMRLGRGLTFLEETIRKTLAPLCRGHVDVQLTLRRISGSDSDVTVDATLAAAYMQAANTLQAATGAANDLYYRVHPSRLEHAHHRIVETLDDGAIVHQEGIRNTRKLLECFVFLDHDRVVVHVARGHDE